MNTPPRAGTLAVLAAAPELAPRAAELAAGLHLPLLPVASDPREIETHACVLLLDGEGLGLQACGRGAPGAVRVDFASAAMRHRRRAGHNELLGRAVGLGKKDVLRIVDATAGLGRDAFVLADLGCQVLMCEREPVVAAMLSEALERGRSEAGEWLPAVLSRLRLVADDARRCPDLATPPPDVIYLDPMFPERGKSAAVKKEMALFQQLFQRPDWEPDGEALLHWALAQDCARVVVKRPLKAPLLAGRASSHTLRGKAVRFDVHVLRALS